MQRTTVYDHLTKLRDAREKWGRARTEFYAGYDVALRRLLFEAAANYMSVRDIASTLGVTPKTIRARMRDLGLDARSKTVLHETASEALANNAELLGIEPSEMDLMSPLAYLPMGIQLKDELTRARVSKVTDLDDGDERTAFPLHRYMAGLIEPNEKVSGNDEFFALLDTLIEEGSLLIKVKGHDYDYDVRLIDTGVQPPYDKAITVHNLNLLRSAERA